MQTQLSLISTCVTPGDSYLSLALAKYMYFPVYVFVFNSVMPLIDNRRYFSLASWILLIFLWQYCRILGEALQTRQHIACHAKHARSFPDPDFVTSMAFTAAVAFGFHRDNIRFNGIILQILAYTSPFLYTIACIRTHYFVTPVELYCNLFAAALFAVVFVGISYVL